MPFDICSKHLKVIKDINIKIIIIKKNTLTVDVRQIIVTGLHFWFLNDKLFGFEYQNVAFPCLVCGNFNYSCS